MRKSKGKIMEGMCWRSVNEAAAYLGDSRENIYSWIDKRDLHAYRVNRFWKFYKEGVDNRLKFGNFADWENEL